MRNTDAMLAEEFVCMHCEHQGATVERRAMSGTGISRFFEIQPYSYAFVSCDSCGYTEIFDLKVLEKRDDLGSFLEVLFLN